MCPTVAFDRRSDAAFESVNVFWLLIPLAFFASFAATGAVRRFAIERNILDIPNARSSHTVIVPRGGGLAIVVVFLACLLISTLLNVLTLRIGAGLFGAGLIIAVTGFVDDRIDLPVSIRIFAHLSATLLLLLALGGAPEIAFNRLQIDNLWILTTLAALYLVWMLNLFNFMDGIDGIAAIEAITVSGGAALLLWLPGNADFAIFLLTLAAAVLGFLIWNWPPAHIFMGDTGSAFLGFILAALSITTEVLGVLDFWVWPILLGVFAVDATVTLLRRLLRRERIFEAHRSHAYQHAAQQFGSHKSVSMAVGVINLLWLLPIAAMVATDRLAGLSGVCIAYLPLVVLALVFKAGVHQNSAR